MTTIPTWPELGGSACWPGCWRSGWGWHWRWLRSSCPVRSARWGPKAEFVRDYISTGDMITAHGAPDVDAWDGRDGANAELTLNADTLEPAGSGGGSQGGQDGPGPAPQSGGSGDDEPFDSSEIPF